MKRIISKILEYLPVLFFVLILFGLLFYSEIFSTGTIQNDFAVHTRWASRLVVAPQKVPPSIVSHAGWHWAVVISHGILGKSWNTNAFVVTLGSVLLTVGILFWLLRKKLSLLLAGALAIGLTIVEPLALLYPFDHQLYLGYIGINTFHNPTILFLKPFAILQLYYAVQTFQKKDSDWKAILITFLVSAAAAFAKPNYIICLLPAMGIIALYHIFKRKIIDWKKLLIGIVLPSVAILIWQFLLTYGSSQEGGIILAPFEVMLVFLSAKFVQISPLINQDIYRVIYLPAKFLLSIVFPVVVTVVYCKEAFKDIRMKLGWIGFGMGVIYTYFFAESTRFSAGNFAWSGQITLFILFICCILFLAEKKLQGINRLSKWLIYISGFLHIIFGIIYYLVVLLTHRYY